MISYTVAGFPFWFIQSGWASLCARKNISCCFFRSSYLLDFLLLEQRTLLTFILNKCFRWFMKHSKLKHISICDIDLVIKYEMLFLKYVIKFIQINHNMFNYKQCCFMHWIHPNFVFHASNCSWWLKWQAYSWLYWWLV